MSTEQENQASFNIDETQYETQLTKKFAARKKYVAPDPKKVLSMIPGTVRSIFVKEGQSVKEGQPLLILESMKMENTIAAPMAGKVRKISVSSDKMIPKGELLVEFE